MNDETSKFNLPFPIEMIPKDGEEHTVVIQHYSNGNSAMMLDGEIVAQNEPFNPAGVTSLDNLSMVLSDDMKTVYNEDKSFSKNLETEGPLTDAEMKRHFRTTAVIDDLANKQ